jgi:hypothetical protein
VKINHTLRKCLDHVALTVVEATRPFIQLEEISMPLSTFRIWDVKGHPLHINADEIVPLPRRRSSLEPVLLQRVRNVYATMKDVIITSGIPEEAAKEFEDSFLCSESPDSDVLMWEAVGATLEKAREVLPVGAYDRKAIYAQIVFIICGGLTTQEFEEPIIKQLGQCFVTCYRANMAARQTEAVCGACYKKVNVAGAVFCPRCGRTLIADSQ